MSQWPYEYYSVKVVDYFEFDGLASSNLVSLNHIVLGYQLTGIIREERKVPLGRLPKSWNVTKWSHKQEIFVGHGVVYFEWDNLITILQLPGTLTSFEQKTKIRAVYSIRYEVWGDKAKNDIFVIQNVLRGWSLLPHEQHPINETVQFSVAFLEDGKVIFLFNTRILLTFIQVSF